MRVGSEHAKHEVAGHYEQHAHYAENVPGARVNASCEQEK
jgi:hypothetical protein